MSEVLQKDPETERLPFQVQVRYKSLDGQQCLRVITESRPVTSDITVANQGTDLFTYSTASLVLRV